MKWPGLPAQIISNGNVHAGRIEEFSGDEMTFVISEAKDFSPQMRMRLHCEVPSGEIYNLTCAFQWFSRISMDDNSLALGLKITEPATRDF